MLNYNKARQSAENSFRKLESNLFYKKLENFDGESASDLQIGLKGAGLLKTLFTNRAKYKLLEKRQLNENLRHLSMSERKNYLHNPNLLDTNSENYLKYKLKQRLSFYEDELNKIP